MQMHEMELWGLLSLLEPEGWNTAEYQHFYRDAEPDLQEWKFRRELWRKSGAAPPRNPVLNSENDDYINLRLKDPGTMKQTLSTMETSAPARRLMSRHTRQLLREYREQGLLDAPIPNRQVRDTIITLMPKERNLYEEITELVQQLLRRQRHYPPIPGFHHDDIQEKAGLVNLRLRANPQERGKPEAGG